MLITFSCAAYANITMFGDIAQQLIQMMGYSGVVPSAIQATDVAIALNSLQNKLASHQLIQSQEQCYNDDGSNISLAHRALPLIQLLQAAIKQRCSVMWY